MSSLQGACVLHNFSIVILVFWTNFSCRRCSNLRYVPLKTAILKKEKAIAFSKTQNFLGKLLCWSLFLSKAASY